MRTIYTNSDSDDDSFGESLSLWGENQITGSINTSMPIPHQSHLAHFEELSKAAISLTDDSKSTSYSTPGYYIVTREGAPQAGPFETYSLAITQLKGRDAISYMDQPRIAPLLEEWPLHLQTVNGSLNDSLDD